jgi:hypothetical protein
VHFFQQKIGKCLEKKILVKINSKRILLIFEKKNLPIFYIKQFEGEKKTPQYTRFYWVEEKQKLFFLCIILLLLLLSGIIIIICEKRSQRNHRFFFFFLFEEK